MISKNKLAWLCSKKDFFQIDLHVVRSAPEEVAFKASKAFYFSGWVEMATERGLVGDLEGAHRVVPSRRKKLAGLLPSSFSDSMLKLGGFPPAGFFEKLECFFKLTF